MKLIPLSGGGHTIVDDDAPEIIFRYKWKRIKSRNVKSRAAFYAARNHGKTQWRLHRLIVGLEKNDPRFVDHIDSDGLNNTRANLRICTQAENARHRLTNKSNAASQFIGVSRSRDKWRARIRINGKRLEVGTFLDPADAAYARDKAAIDLHGDFAVLNFPEVVKK